MTKLGSLCLRSHVSKSIMLKCQIFMASVDFSDLNIDFSDLYVDLSFVHLSDNNSQKLTCSCQISALQIPAKLSAGRHYIGQVNIEI